MREFLECTIDKIIFIIQYNELPNFTLTLLSNSGETDWLKSTTFELNLIKVLNVGIHSVCRTGKELKFNNCFMWRERREGWPLFIWPCSELDPASF